MSFHSVKFSFKDHQLQFFPTVRQRVQEYFEKNGISTYANAAMVVKTMSMLLMYVIPFVLIVTAVSTSTWLNLVFWFIMGLGMAGLGLSVMHDANHGAYSKYTLVNKLVGSVMYIIGGNPVNWRIQHNVLHHSFTNVDGVDEDIDTGSILRFSPHQKAKKIHRYQHLYAWFLYSLMTVMWATTKDFRQLYRYKKLNLHQTQKRKFSSLLFEITISKIAYFIVFLIIPLLMAGVSWYITLIGFIIMHLVCGFILSCIFQPAHVMPHMSFPLPDESGNIQNSWAIHEMLTTGNFAPNNKILSWFAGGLNFQIEHHLFPNICHVHYKKISDIVKKTAEEFMLPYYCEPSFRMALYKHGQMLKQLGRG